LIENTPTARIRSMAMGLVEINGDIVQRSEHMAPFSGRPCAYWQVDIATRGRNNSWSIVAPQRLGQPVLRARRTGLALVYPKGADCKVQHQVEETCVGINLPECYSQYMEQQHLAFRHIWQLSTLRFRERTLEEGQRVFVLGTALPRPQVAPCPQDDSSRPPAPMVRTSAGSASCSMRPSRPFGSARARRCFTCGRGSAVPSTKTRWPSSSVRSRKRSVDSCQMCRNARCCCSMYCE